MVRAAAVGLGLSAAATWFLGTVSTRVQRRFRDKVTIALESHVARLQASLVTVAHHERPEFLDRLSMLRDQVFVLDHMYMSVFSTCGWVLRLGVTVARWRPSIPPGAAGGIRTTCGSVVRLTSHRARRPGTGPN
jgi:ATP-binding cassette subfamily B protein